MEEAGFEDIWDYILKRKNTFAQYIATWEIMDLCKRTVQRLGAWVYSILWGQEGTILAGARYRVAAADGWEEREGEDTSQ